MNRATLTAVGAAVLAATSVVAHAQTLPAPLLDAARKAVVSNPEVQARWHAFQGSEAEGISVWPRVVPLWAKNRFCQVGPGIDECHASHTAKFLASPCNADKVSPFGSVGSTSK